MQRATLVGQEASECCAGLPLDEVRPLSDFELTSLRSEARRLWMWGVLALLSLSLVIGGLCLPEALLADPHLPNSVINALGLFLSVATPAIFVFAPILAYRYLCRAATCGRDARAGCMKRFEGCIGIGTTIDGALTQNRLLRADANALQSLELLPSSGRLWSANGRMAPFWIILQTTTVANTPANAYAAVREFNTGEEAAGARLIGERELSAKEREELTRHIGRVGGTNSTAAILLTAWLTFLSILDWSYHTWAHPWFVVVWAVFFVATIWKDFAFINGAVRVYRLNRDRKAGKVLMLTLPVEGKDESGAEASTREIETLPYSRSLWTSSGGPAGWRKSRL